jgi:hypothetical protein
LPRLQRLQDRLGAHGLEILTINCGDSPEVVRKYLVDNGLTLKTGVTGERSRTGAPVTREYAVMQFPTNYLLDAKGRVRYRREGFDSRELRRELARLGLVVPVE